MIRYSRFFMALTALVFISGCTEVQLASHLTKRINPPPKSVGTFKVGSSYKIKGKTYYPQEDYEYVETGIASWYGPQFHGKQTANGEIFDMNELTAAHKTLQMPSLVRVTNLDNGRSLVVRVNDRGPYSRGRIIDLSKRSAELLGFKVQGTAKVKVEVMKQESLQIAQAAKQGIDTSGYEVAVNRGQGVPSHGGNVQVASARPQQVARPSPSAVPQSTYQRQVQNIETAGVNTSRNASIQSVQQEALTSPVPTSQGRELTNVTPGHMKNGNFYPDPIVTEMPVTKTDMYVQAGAFSVEANALNLSRKLAAIGPSNVYPALVNGTQYYRVRLGPVGTVAEADAMLERLIASGNNAAIIVVE